MCTMRRTASVRWIRNIKQEIINKYLASLKNPFIPLDVENPSLAQMRQRVLKGKGRPERLDIMKKTMECWGHLMAGQEYDKEAMVAYYNVREINFHIGKFHNLILQTMAEDIKTQKERIGGDWAIAHVVMKNEHRAALRKCLGSQLYLVNLVMSTEDRRKRVLDRHMGDEGIGDMMDVGAAKFKIIDESSLRDSV